MKAIRLLVATGSALMLASCGPGGSGGGSGGGADKFAACNKKSSTLQGYSECRCRQITGAKSWTKEMDDCMTNPKVYAEGFAGEIPKNIRDKMK